MAKQAFQAQGSNRYRSHHAHRARFESHGLERRNFFTLISKIAVDSFTRIRESCAPMTKIRCPKCEGKGRVPLPEWAQQILALFVKNNVLRSDEILERIPDDITQNAINNRLERMRAMRLLKRAREGKWWRYSRA